MTAKQTDAATASTGQNEQAQERQSREERQGGQGRAGRTGQDNRLARLDLSSPFMSPFALLQRFFTDDVGSLFDQFGGRRAGMTPQTRTENRDVIAWVPKVDVVQRGNELVVHADLPGMKADDVTVEISDDAITISGERQDERAEETGGVYRVERTYGAFLREIPLPEGAIVDQAKASFKDGVLQITVPAPPEQVSRGRRLEISQGDQASKSEANKEGAQKEAGR